MKKEMMIALMCLLLVSLVRADVNLALGSTPSFFHSSGGDSTCGGCPYGVGWKTNSLYLNDGNINNPVGTCISTYGGAYSGTYTAEINLDNKDNQINSIQYVAWGYAYGQSGTMLTSLYYGGSWHNVNSRSITLGGASPSPQTVTISVGSPWYDVEKIRIYTTLHAQLYYCVQNYVYEIRALGTFCGDGSCNGNEDCGNCIADCGPCCTPDCNGKECGNDGCGGSCGDCDILYPGEGRICDSGICILPVSTVYWAFLNGSETENAEIGDTVWMIYPDEPGSYNFDIKEKDLVGDVFIRTVPSTETFHRDADLVAEWKITQSDWDIGKDLDGSNEFFFDVNSQISKDLNVVENIFKNDMPETQIILPEEGSNYTLDVAGTTASISFEQISDDPDDYLRGIWTFGDGKNSGWMNYCSKTGIGTDCNTTHQYTGKGAIDIKFRVEEMTRNQWNDDSTKIFIYGPGINVIAEITEPKYNKTIEGRAVYIDASKSKVINCSYSLAECNNAASPATCDTIDDAEGINPTLYCYQLPNRGVDYNLIFEWTFDGVIGKIGNWGAGNDGYYDYVEFVQGFRDPGEHDIGLRVGYEAI